MLWLLIPIRNYKNENSASFFFGKWLPTYYFQKSYLNHNILKYKEDCKGFDAKKNLKRFALAKKSSGKCGRKKYIIYDRLICKVKI